MSLHWSYTASACSGFVSGRDLSKGKTMVIVQARLSTFSLVYIFGKWFKHYLFCHLIFVRFSENKWSFGALLTFELIRDRKECNALWSFDLSLNIFFIPCSLLQFLAHVLSYCHIFNISLQQGLFPLNVLI